jgi:hypothetical protein
MKLARSPLPGLQTMIRWWRSRETKAVVLCFILCACVFTARNLDPLLAPTLYAEDGTWIGLLMHKGLLHTAFYARQGFPVLGLALLDLVALQLNALLSGGDLFTLPYYVWAVSIAFLSVVSVLPLVAFRPLLPLSYRLGLVAILPLMSTGPSGNEIFGRIGNLVYIFPVVCTYCICLWRLSPRRAQGFYACLAVLCVSSLTFPVCLGLFFLWVMFEMLFALSRVSGLSLARVIQLEPLAPGWIAWLVVGLALCFFLMPDNLFAFKGGADMPVSSAGWVDYVGARLVLYPLIAAFYGKMTDAATLLACFGIGLIFVLALMQSPASEMRFALVAFTISFAVYAAATAIMRPGFTSLFGNYANTFPDRYFYGINVLFVTAFLLAVYQFAQWRKLAFAAVLIAFCANVAMRPRNVFEWTSPTMHWRQYGDLRQMTCLIVSGRGPTQLSYEGEWAILPVYPIVENFGWRMMLPKSVLSRSVESGCAA